SADVWSVKGCHCVLGACKGLDGASTMRQWQGTEIPGALRCRTDRERQCPLLVVLPQLLQQLPTALWLSLTAVHQLRCQHRRQPYHQTLHVCGVKGTLQQEGLESCDGQVRDTATVRRGRRRMGRRGRPGWGPLPGPPSRH